MKKREAVIISKRGNRGKGISSSSASSPRKQANVDDVPPVDKESEDQRILRKLGMQQNKYTRDRVSCDTLFSGLFWH